MKFTGLFEFGPHLAIAVLVVGTLVRQIRMKRRGSSIVRSEVAVRSSNGATGLWRATLLVLFVAHLAGLMTPRAILAWNRAPLRLYVLEATGMAIGIAVLVGCIVATVRHLLRSSASMGEAIGDSLFLSATLLTVGTGLFTAIFYRWASNWSVATITPYIRSLAQGHDSTRFVAALPFAVRLHVVSGFAAVALFPFSSVAPSVLAALNRPMAWLARPFTAGARSGEAWARRHNPAAWIWPEED